MTGKIISQEVEEVIRIMTDLQATIRINFEILEILKLKGRIKLTDKKFIEITELDIKHRKEYEKFVLSELPQFIDGDLSATQKVLKKSFMVWTTDQIISLRYLDKTIKEFLGDINEKDLKNKKALKSPEVKDKRFWKFLDMFRTKSQLFESFQEPEDADILELDEASSDRADDEIDPEADKENNK